jgi:DNA replication and repair protein RecF
MHLSFLSLTDFRSYSTLELSLQPKTQIFLGDNGEGKTNIVEAIMFLALLTSHRVATTAPLIKLGSERAYIRARVTHEQQEKLIELEINNGKANRAKINHNPVRSQREIAGLVHAICFSPEDLDLVRGDPHERRSFLDHIIVQHSPRMNAVIADYERAVRQRNTLLKAHAPQSSISPWDEHLSNFGSQVLAARIGIIEALQPFFTASYSAISSKKNAVISYKSSIDNPTKSSTENSELILAKIKELSTQERDRGVSLVGPHRDDLLLNLGNQPVKGYASHGESWSIALALRLASYELLREGGSQPILILDDVFSELDEARRHQLSQVIETAEQTFITVAVENDLPEGIKGTKFLVSSGTVRAL